MKRNVLYYFSYLSIVLLCFYFHVKSHISIVSNRSIGSILSLSNPDAVLFYIFEWIKGIVLGAVLGFDLFLDNIEKGGKWKVNLKRLLILGIPALFFSTDILLAISVWCNFEISYTYMCGITSSIPLICRIWLGFIIITSIMKKREGTFNNT